MKLLSLKVEHFRCVRKARLEFGPGLNVFYGPNDLGKSSLAAAIRAALLLQVSSREHEAFLAWDCAGDPHVELVFESEAQRIWRVKKTFGSHPQAFLEESRDGVDFHVEARGRDVEGRLGEILRWGLAPPGGKGRPKGMPVTFLSTALLAEQDQVAAIFGQRLSDDSDESGKKFLIDALHAAAEDPLFKAVLNQVQEEVNQAFGSSGQRRRGKDSPWSKIRDQMQRAEEDERHCSEQLQKSSAIEAELQELLGQRLGCEAALAAAVEGLEVAESEHKRGRQRAEILTRLGECKGRLNEITAVLAKKAEAEARMAELSQAASKLAAREIETQRALAEAVGAAEQAKEKLRVLGDDRIRERQLKQSELEKRRAELAGDQARNDSALTRLRGVEAIADRARKIEGALGELAEGIDGLAREHAEAAKAVQVVDEDERALLGIAQLIREKAAQAGVAEADNGLAQIEVWREEAGRKRSAATAIQTMVDEVTLPTAEELDGLNRLERQLQIARARLDVGLHIQLRPKHALRLSFRTDGGETELRSLHDGSFEASANREIRLEIEDVAAMTFSGGAAGTREEVERLQKQWLAEAEPVLKQAGVAKLDELGEAIQERARRLQEMREIRQAAAVLEQRVTDQRDWAALRAERQQQAAAAKKALQGADRVSLDAMARKLGIGDAAAAETRLAKLRANRPKLVEKEQKLGGQCLAANTQRLEKEEALHGVRQELVAAETGIEGDWRKLLPQLAAAQAGFAAKSRAVELEWKALVSETDKTLTEAEAALARAEKARSAAGEEHAKAGQELRTAENRRATAEGELNMLREGAAKLDEAAARHAVNEVGAELSGVPAAAREITEGSLTEAREAVQAARDGLRNVEDAIQLKRGALHHVGGGVAKDRVEDAREALKMVKERERNLELDSEAWALLRETLLEAEQEEGVHLGRVLGGPIVQRFGDLTNGRYGKIALGPDLETDTISVAGEGRPIGSLSVGTRDQLSIIFRLTLAEQLGSAVVLDDQLTQTDADRMVWLRDLIRRMAANIQIVVFTCRAGDYLLPAELKAAKKTAGFNPLVHSADLTTVIERSGVVAGGK